MIANLNIHKWISLASLFWVLTACTNFNSNSKFEEFKSNFIEEYFLLIPEAGLYRGRYEFAGQLTVPNESHKKAVEQFVVEQGKGLNSFDYSKLNQVNASDWWIIQNQISKLKWYQESLKAYEWNPAQYNVASAIGKLLNENYESTEKRLLDIGDRLVKVPEYYSVAIQNLKQMTLPHTELAIKQNSGTINLLKGRLQKQIDASSLLEEEKKLITELNSNSIVAIEKYVSWLETQLVELKADPSKARSFRIGEKLYEEKFSLDIGSAYSAKEIFQLALQEKDRLHSEMIKQSKVIWSKYFPGEEFPVAELDGVKRLIAKVSERHAKPEEFVESVKKQIPELEKFLLEKDLMDIDPEKPLVVRETPEYQRGFSIASIQSPGPYDTDGNTYYNVQPIDGYSEERQQSHLREYNYYMMQILNIHEAIPGHYTQLVHANKSPSLVKSIFGNGAMIEGWAVYTERMMLEEGYGDFSPELWLMYYKWNLRTVVNTILDYKIQVLGLEEEGALDLLINEAFQESEEARGKWVRATLSQVQLTSYFTGYKEIYEFRESLKAKDGEDFNLKAFHNEFLSYGSAPVKVIKKLMLEDRKSS